MRTKTFSARLMWLSSSFTNSKARRGFEPRSTDSESVVLTATPTSLHFRGCCLWIVPPCYYKKEEEFWCFERIQQTAHSGYVVLNATPTSLRFRGKVVQYLNFTFPEIHTKQVGYTEIGRRLRSQSVSEGDSAEEFNWTFEYVVLTIRQASLHFRRKVVR